MWFIGEALGKDEVGLGLPFQGQAGQVLDRTLKLSGIHREDVFIHNIISCRPPENKLVGEAYEVDAINHCTTKHLWPLINAYNPPAIVALGGSATRHLLNLPKEKFSINNWHGCPTKLHTSDTFIIPSFHPAYISRGQQRLVGACIFDFQRANLIAHGHPWTPEGATLHVDIDPREFGVHAKWFVDNWKDRRLRLYVDIETKDKKGRDEDDIPDESWDIDRINFSWDGKVGFTVLWNSDYLPWIIALLETEAEKGFWNKNYDVKRIRHHSIKINGRILDFMHAWKMLQSNHPMGLGYVSPFYSGYGAWKHLSAVDPGLYAAIDPVQTLRCAQGIERDLHAIGQWYVFEHHMVDLDTYVLEPAAEVGLAVDEAALDIFAAEVDTLRKVTFDELTTAYPPELRRLHPKQGWKKKPSFPLTVEYKRGQKKEVVSYEETDLRTSYTEAEVTVCMECGKEGVTKSHKHKTAVARQTAHVPLYQVQEPFNPGSAQQILAYADYKGHYTGRDKSTDKNTLARLSKKDKFYRGISDYREIDKLKGTYVDSTKRRIVLFPDRRIHTTWKRTPSTQRLSSVNPNITNQITERASKLAVRYRNCIVASPGHSLVGTDFAGIEAVQTGWYQKDPDYIRLATLGVHAYVTSHYLGRPADLSWANEDLVKYFADLKAHHYADYDLCKHVTHGTNYGLSVDGMCHIWPELFTEELATKIQGLYFDLCPKLKEWQNEVREAAHQYHFIGGRKHPNGPSLDHPFGYRHWFWDVWSYNKKRITKENPEGHVRGKDYNRVVAFYPQSTAAGVLYDSALRLADPNSQYYIGELSDFKSPFRALIHDEILTEIRDDKVEEAIFKMQGAMTLPILSQPCPKAWGIGEHLKIGVETKVGKNWGAMKKVNKVATLASDIPNFEDEEADEEALPEAS